MENEIYHIKLEDIIPSKDMPQEVSNNISEELINSIANHGVIQPIVVKKINDKYEIVDGNRRYFASCKIGLTKIPALIRNNDNITRINLNDNLYNITSPIEEAKKYKEILETSKITQEELAKSIGKSQSAVANKLRLLNLPIEIQNALNNNEISERHARSLLTVKDYSMQIELLNKIKNEKITVRELDSEIKNMSNMFIPEEFSNNVNNSQSQSNSFIPNNMDSGFVNNNNNFNNAPVDNNMFIPQGNPFMNNNQNMMNVDISQNDPFTPSFPNNNGGMNPFLTSNNYNPPMSNLNNEQASMNPFSSIRMNTNNISVPTPPTPFYTENSNNQVNNDGNNNINNNEVNSFNLDDYKLPEYENENNNFAQENYNQPINSFNPIDLNNNDNNVSDSTNLQNQYQYVEDNPNYTSVDMPQGVSSIDDVINILRNTLDTIKNGKLRVDTEEIDYDDSYQITIRIDKKGDFS